jgi:hypothetical protein
MKIKKCLTCSIDFTPHLSRNKCDKCKREEYYAKTKENAKNKPKKEIKKVSFKQRKVIVDNKEYYQQEIMRHKEENKGNCPCENCGMLIENPSGRNVSHIIAGSANRALYHHPNNRFILCNDCEYIWTNRDKTTMKIYDLSEDIIIQLNNFYYTTIV